MNLQRKATEFESLQCFKNGPKVVTCVPEIVPTVYLFESTALDE